MKKFWNIFSLLFVSAALFTACFSPITQGKDSGEPGYTKVQIDFSGSGERTIYPNKVFDHYVYMFTVEGGTPQEMTPVDGWFTLETRPDSTAPLKPANWSVAVQAYIGAIDPANLAATGTASFSIMHDDAITVPVTLVSETTGGAGVFMYNITYPQGAEVELFTVEKLPELTESITLSAAAGQTSVAETVNNVPAGFYLITVLLKTDDGAGGALYAGKNEVVHIYDKMTSVYGTAQAPITFTADDFSPEVVFERPALTGEVSIEGDAAVGQTLTVNTDALNGDGHNNYQWKRGDSAVTVSENIGTDETYTVSPADLTKYITVSVSRTENSGSVTSEPIGPVTGVQYTVTFDSSGGSDVTSQQVWNGQKLTAPEDPVKTNLIFDAWYKDAAFENVWNFNTDVITGDITLYAKWNSRVILDWNYADDGWLYNDSGINDLPTGPGVTGGDPVHYLNYDKPNAKKFQGITLSSGRNKRVFEDPQHGGIRIGLINAIDSNGVIGGNNTSRLLIGHSDNTDSSATGAWYDSSYGLPELDLSKMVVKVTIGYTYYSFGQDGYGLRLLVNNNSTTSNAGPITNFLSAAPYSSDTSMVGRWADASNDTSHSVSLFTRAGTAATNISQTGKLYAFIDPNKPDLKGNISTLKNAYLCLMGNTGGSTVDKYIIVSSIRIEYVDEVPAGWPSVTYTEEAPVQTYIVSFNANAGTDAVTGMPGQITDLESGASISMPGVDPVRAGYHFTGWFKDSACNDLWDFDTDTVSANTTLYAGWERDTTIVTVTFDANAGVYSVSGMPASQIVNNGSVVSAPGADPVRAGFTFEGWFTEADCQNEWDFTVDTVTSDTTLFAKWISDGTNPTWGVSVTPNPATLPTVGLGYGTNDTGLTITVTNTGNQPTGPLTFPSTQQWNGQGTGNNGAFEFDNTSWAKVNPAGTGALKNGLAVGASDTLLIRIRQGQAAGTEYGSFTITGANGINLTVNASITVDYAVTFNGNGTGVVGLPAQIFADGTTIAKPAPDPTRSGFVFDGWYKESACTNIWDFDVDIVTANITLYARWISVAPLPDFELTVTPLPLILPPATSGSISTNNVGYQLTLSNTGVKATGKLIFSSDFYTADLYPDGMTSQDWNGIANNTGGIFQFDNTSWGKVNPATPGSLLAGLAPGASDTLICRARTGMPAGTFSYSFTITNETGEINVTVTASITIAAAGSFAAVFHHNADSDGVNVTNMPDPQNNLASGSAITAPVSDPVRPGYTFNGWYRGTVNAGNAGTNPGQPVIEANPWNFANTISANTILFAKWTKNP